MKVTEMEAVDFFRNNKEHRRKVKGVVEPDGWFYPFEGEDCTYCLNVSAKKNDKGYLIPPQYKHLHPHLIK